MNDEIKTAFQWLAQNHCNIINELVFALHGKFCQNFILP